MVVLNASAVTVGTVPMLLVSRQTLDGCMECNPPPSPPRLMAGDRIVEWRGKQWTIEGVEVNGERNHHVVAVGARWVATLVTYDIRSTSGSRSTGSEKCLCGNSQMVRYDEGKVVVLLTRGPRRQDTARMPATEIGPM